MQDIGGLIYLRQCRSAASTSKHGQVATKIFDTYTRMSPGFILFIRSGLFRGPYKQAQQIDFHAATLAFSKTEDFGAGDMHKPV
jgi:hypothetical protein